MSSRRHTLTAQGGAALRVQSSRTFLLPAPSGIDPAGPPPKGHADA
jgi:hypothetical protein